jgi:DNA helicase-2/ATP-dependent DNA helicase PcrA
MEIDVKKHTASLNEYQHQAATMIKGPLLIAAGPGSGKTRTVSHRAAYMIQEENIDPSQILLITFTKKAADEMKQRISKLLDSENLPFIGTFHSLCLHILRNYSFKLSIPKNFTVYDPTDQLHIVQSIIKDAKQKSLQDLLKRISYCKNHLILPSETPIELQEPYRQYQAMLREENALDFDDLIVKTVQLFRKHPEVLSAIPWHYISVDEYQDTNHAQYELIKLLAKRDRNICVIGDADQSIYAFRGANVENFLNFGNDFPEVKVVRLEQNYRSSPEIINGSQAVIKENEDRMQQKLWTAKQEGKPIIICNASDERAEVEYIIRTIELYMGGTSRYQIEVKNVDDESKGFKFSDFAVLFRTHMQGKIIEEMFLKSGIPYQLVGAIPFYNKAEVKDLIAYLRVIYDPNDMAALLRIINKPARGIGKICVDKIKEYVKHEGIPFYQVCQEVDALSLNDEQKNAVARFVTLIESLRYENTHVKFSDLVRSVIQKIQLFELYKDKKRQDHLYEIMGFASVFDDLPHGESLKEFLRDATFMSDKDIYDSQKDAITLLTLHASKGLEFPVVFIAGVEEQFIPYKHGDEKLNEPEERRLFYVGMTRAQDELHLIHTNERNFFGEELKQQPSRFLNSIPVEVIRKKEHERKKRIKKKDETDKSQLKIF